MALLWVGFLRSYMWFESLGFGRGLCIDCCVWMGLSQILISFLIQQLCRILEVDSAFVHKIYMPTAHITANKCMNALYFNIEVLHARFLKFMIARVNINLVVYKNTVKPQHRICQHYWVLKYIITWHFKARFQKRCCKIILYTMILQFTEMQFWVIISTI